MSVEAVLKTMLEKLESLSRTEMVIGKPIQAGESTLIPVSKISLGFGAVSGEKPDKEKGLHLEGDGSGGGMVVEPVAFILVSGDKAQLLSLKEPQKASPWGALFELFPDLADKIKKILDKKNKSEPETTDTKSGTSSKSKS